MSFKKTFPLTNSPNRGLISYLATNQQLDQIEVNATEIRPQLSNPTTYYYEKHAIDGDIYTRYCSIEVAGYGQYYQLHLLSSSLYITGYSLHYLNTHDSTICAPKQWEFLGTNNINEDFTVIHSQEPTEILGDKFPHIFKISEDKRGIFKYFKIVNKGPAICNQNRLYITEIDLFGTAFFNHNINFCVTQQQIYNSLLSYFIYINKHNNSINYY